MHNMRWRPHILRPLRAKTDAQLERTRAVRNVYVYVYIFWGGLDECVSAKLRTGMNVAAAADAAAVVFNALQAHRRKRIAFSPQTIA